MGFGLDMLSTMFRRLSNLSRCVLLTATNPVSTWLNLRWDTVEWCSILEVAWFFLGDIASKLFEWVAVMILSLSDFLVITVCGDLSHSLALGDSLRLTSSASADQSGSHAKISFPTCSTRSFRPKLTFFISWRSIVTPFENPCKRLPIDDLVSSTFLVLCVRDLIGFCCSGGHSFVAGKTPKIALGSPDASLMLSPACTTRRVAVRIESACDSFPMPVIVLV